jgi:hypothetical protein
MIEYMEAVQSVKEMERKLKRRERFKAILFFSIGFAAGMFTMVH